MDALEVVHERAAAEAGHAPIHHDAVTIRAVRNHMRRITGAGENIGLELEDAQVGAVEPAWAMMNELLFH